MTAGERGQVPTGSHAARRRSHAAGLSPTALIGGVLVAAAAVEASRIVRRRAAQSWTPPSGSITHGSLTARRLGSSGPAVVLLHGMAASQVYWGGGFDAIAQDAQLVVVDLLGFGSSPKPPTGYSPRGHADAVAACLRELGIDQPAVVVGHSMGCVVALALATYHPELVDRIVAIAPPIYDSRAAGVRHIRGMGTLEGLMAFGVTSRLMCRWMCSHRPLATRLAPMFEPSLPAAIAREGAQHTWASYSQSMEELILSCDARDLLAAVRRPVHIIAALDDPVPDLPLLSQLRESNHRVSLDIWSEGGHQLPLTRLTECREAISRAVRAAGPSEAAGIGRGRRVIQAVLDMRGAVPAVDRVEVPM